MTTAGSGPRTEAWRRIRALLFAPQVVVAIILTVGAVIGVFVGSTALLGAAGLRTDTSLSAFLAGFLIATFLGGMWYLIGVMSGGSAWLVGATAERWTDQELAQLGPAWRRFHGVVFEDGAGGDRWQVDVDHVVVGPYGVLVVESKYSSGPLDLGALRLPKVVREAVGQARANAGRVRGLLYRDYPNAPVRPVVVFWGRLVKAPVTGVRRLGEVRVVAGTDADRWRPLLTTVEVVTPEVVDLLAAKVERHLSREEALKSARRTD